MCDIPPPRFHGAASRQLRYHGILAPNAKYRSHAVQTTGTISEISSDPPPRNKAKRSWAQLLNLFYDIDMICPSCGAEMKIVAFITNPWEVKRYLECTSESTETPHFAQARASPTKDLFRDSHPDSVDLFSQESSYQDMEEIQHQPEEFWSPLESDHLPKPQRDQSAYKPRNEQKLFAVTLGSCQNTHERRRK